MRFLRTCTLAAIASAVLFGAQAHAQVRINIDTSLADRALGLVCTGQDIDEAAVRASSIVQAQIEHNSGLRDTATMDNYVAALRALSACQAPDPDPFNVAAVLADPAAFRTKIAAIRARQDEIAASVERRLTPYMPPGASFDGGVILAVPYFSCGGFAANEQFFIDIRCLDSNLDLDMLALELLVTHETYHVVQERFFRPLPDSETLSTRREALSLFFGYMLIEGSATFVASPTQLPATGGGPLTRLNRNFHLANQRRMETNFALMTILIEQLARSRTPRQDFESAVQVAFSGSSYEEIGYHVAARMMRDIEDAWGAPTTACIFRLPAEQLVLAHDAVTTGQADALRLGAPAIEAARSVARGRTRAERYESCR